MKKIVISILALVVILLFMIIINSKTDNNTILNDNIKKQENTALQNNTIPVAEKMEYIGFAGYEDFYFSVKTSKRNLLKNKRMTKSRIESVTHFFDFENLNYNIILGGIDVDLGSMTVKYYDKSIKEGKMEVPNNEILLYSKQSTKNDNYVDSWYDTYSKTGTAEKMTINGVSAVKKIVERDGKLISYQYHWVQEGYNIFMNLKKGIVEQYDENIFFDVKKVKIPD